MDTYEGMFKRRGLARQFDVKSIAFVPTVGGVMEIGNSRGPATRDWSSLEDIGNGVPNTALEQAFTQDSATYAIFWNRNFATGQYEVCATFESAANKLNKKALENSVVSFSSRSAAFSSPIMGNSPIATAGKSGVDVVIPEVSQCPGFQRKALAEEFGVGKMNFVPCEAGVLEYGTVTKDKRQTTVGAEYQEASRQYRRSVFDHEQWSKHRSAASQQLRRMDMGRPHIDHT